MVIRDNRGMKRPKVVWAAVLGAVAAAFIGALPAHADAAADSVYFNIRYSSGSWQGFQAPAQPSGCCAAVGEASDPVNDTTHVDVVGTDGFFDDIRSSDGSWSGWTKPPQPPDADEVSALGEAGDAAGTIWVFLYTDYALYYDYRLTSGTWGSWKQLALPFTQELGVSSIAVATTDDPSDQVQVMFADDSDSDTGQVAEVWHRVYTVSSGTWTGWAQPTQVPGQALSVAAAGEVNGDVQFIALNYEGYVYHDIRYEDGKWQGWDKPAQLPDPGGVSEFSSVTAAADGDGNAQFVVDDATDSGSFVLYHDIRYAAGTWQSGWEAIKTPDDDCYSVAATTQTYLTAPSDFDYTAAC